MPFKLELKQTRRGMHILETTPRYDVVLNGVTVGQLYYNTRGYVGNLPMPSGGILQMPEGSITSYKRVVARLNREAKELPQVFDGEEGTYSDPKCSTCPR